MSEPSLIYPHFAVPTGILQFIKLLVSRVVFVILLSALSVGMIYAQSPTVRDTLLIPERSMVEMSDTLFITTSDTVVYVLETDSVSIIDLDEERSKAFYDSLKNKADRHKVTGLLYDLVVREQQRVENDTSNFVDSKAPYYPFEGQQIRSVRFKKVPVLDGSVLDTALLKSTTVGKAANAIHVNTRTNVLRKLLMFEERDVVSPNEMADSERLIRQLPYIQDALIVVIPIEGVIGEVDVVVITQDRFSIIVGGSPRGFSKFDLRVGDRNFLGSGRKLQTTYIYDGSRDPASGIDLEFNDPSLYGKYINSTLRWRNNYDQKGWELIMTRDLYAPGVKWIGGVEWRHINVNRFRTTEEDRDNEIYPYEIASQDLWAGRSFQLGDEDNRNNLTITQRYYRQQHDLRPFVSSDSNVVFQNASLYVGGIAFTKQFFQKSSKILSFGITEDVPSGMIFEFNPGYVFGEFNSGPYLGYRISAARYFPKIGFVSATNRFGGIVDRRGVRDGVIDFGLRYFSPLKSFPKREFRQFVNLRLIRQINLNEGLQVSYGDNDRNIDLREVEGDRVINVDLESVVFHPRKWYGFQLASYLFTSFGWLADRSSLIRASNFYGAVGLGFRIRNESLAIQTLQISAGYFLETIDNVDSFFYDFNVDDPLLFDDFRGLKPEVLRFE